MAGVSRSLEGSGKHSKQWHEVVSEPGRRLENGRIHSAPWTTELRWWELNSPQTSRRRLWRRSWEGAAPTSRPITGKKRSIFINQSTMIHTVRFHKFLIPSLTLLRLYNTYQPPELPINIFEAFEDMVWLFRANLLGTTFLSLERYNEASRILCTQISQQVFPARVIIAGSSTTVRSTVDPPTIDYWELCFPSWV